MENDNGMDPKIFRESCRNLLKTEFGMEIVKQIKEKIVFLDRSQKALNSESAQSLDSLICNHSLNARTNGMRYAYSDILNILEKGNL